MNMKKYDHKVVWTTLENALKVNHNIGNSDICPWNIREIKVMQYLLL